MINVIPGRSLPAPNFAYHLPKPWTDRFSHVNGKQTLFQSCFGITKSAPGRKTVFFGSLKNKEIFRGKHYLAFLYLLKSYCIQKVARTQFWKHRLTREKKKNEELFFFSTTLNPLRWRSSPEDFIFYHAHLTDFEEKIEGLWTGYTKEERIWIFAPCRKFAMLVDFCTN